jgi:ribosomal protein S13
MINSNNFYKINYGINKNIFKFFFKSQGINFKKPTFFANQKKILKLSRLKNKKFGQLLKLKVKKIKKFEESIKTFKGLRNKYNYPCRGQRTRTNAKSKKKFKNL